MKTIKQSLIFILTLVTLNGCGGSSGFHQGSINSQLAYDAATTDKEIEKVLNLKPQLRSQFRLAVYLDQKTMNYWDYPYWRWSEEDKDSIYSMLKNFDKNIISEVFFIPGSMVGVSNLKEIRLAAARHHADAVLIIRGINDLRIYANKWSFSYITIIAGWFVPGSDMDSYFKISATMWDVRNEYLYTTVEAESFNHTSKPAFLLEEEALVTKTKNEAFNSFNKEFRRQFSSLAFGDK